VFTGSGACEQQWGWDITGAYRHYWIPSLSSSVFGSYMEVHYPADALNGFGGAVGVSNLKEGRVGTNLVWTPLKGFDIGAEFTYVHLNETRPVGLAPNSVLNADGLPRFSPTTISTRAACAFSGRSEPGRLSDTSFGKESCSKSPAQKRRASHDRRPLQCDWPRLTLVFRR